MEKLNFNLGEQPTIKIDEIRGKLTIKGWDSAEINCEASSRELLEVEEKKDNLTLSSNGNCSLRVPVNTNFQIKSVLGNLEINHISGEISIDEVMGAANVFNSSVFKADVINGNSNISQIDDQLHVKTINGNLSMRDIFGNTTVEECSGNISVSGISGGFDLNTSGNTIFNLDPDPGKEYRVKSSGNIFCQVPSSTGFEAELVSSSGIQVNAPVMEIEETGPDTKHIQIGDGASKFFFESSGRITISVEGHYGKYSKHKEHLKENLKDLSNDIASEAINAIEKSLDELNLHLQELTLDIPGDRVNLRNTRKGWSC